MGGAMLIATFGPSTGWVGNTITFENEQFILEGHGAITPQDVAEYDRQGHLTWPYDWMRAWVYVRAVGLEPTITRETVDPATPARSDAARQDVQVLIFDTETSDLPRNWRRPASDVDNWPRLVQVAWVACDLKLRAKRKYVTLIRPDGWEIAPGAARVHGISTEKALRGGVPVTNVLPAFDAELQTCSVIVANNLEFDEAVMTAEFIRAGLPHHFGEVNRFCTMRGTTQMCQLEPMIRGEYKWPKLSELHELCTGRPHEGAHDAMGDVEAVIRCLHVMLKKDLVEFRVSQKK